MTWRRGGGGGVVCCFWAFRLLRQCQKSSVTCSYNYRTLQVHLSFDALFVVFGWVTECITHCTSISSSMLLRGTLRSWYDTVTPRSRIWTLNSCKASNLQRTLIEMIWNNFVFEHLDIPMNYACFKRLWKWSFQAVAGYYGKDQWLSMSYSTLLAGLDSIYVDILMVTQLNIVDWLNVKILRWLCNWVAMYIFIHNEVRK